MRDLRFKTNIANGLQGFAFDERGDVVFDESEAHAVMSSLVEQRGKWWADPAGTHGSRLRTIRTITASTQSDAEAFAREALAKLVATDRISLKRVVVSIPRTGVSGRVEVAVYWASRGSSEEQMTRVYV
jgi:phage gp46-like protein